MDRVKQVRTARRTLSVNASERWGRLPRPRVGVDTVEQRARYNERQRARAVFDSTAYRSLRISAERMIGATLDFADLPPNEQALKAGRPVARIVTLGGAGIVPQGFATGFLVAPTLLLTNYHVFRTADEAEHVGAQFLYEQTKQGLREGVIFEADPARFFLNHKGLDYAVVALKSTATSGAPLSQFKYLPLIASQGKIRKGDHVNIIQHPQGQPKQYATTNNRLLDLRDDGFLLYETDTLEGSSGSPVFNDSWETIGLHHSGVPLIENNKLVTRSGDRVPLDADVEDDDLVWVANEGIRVSALVASLASQRLADPDKQRILDEFLATTDDPLKMVAENSPLVGVPATVNPIMNGETAMAQQIFQFSGPVTIQLGAPPPAVTVGPAVTVAPPAPDQARALPVAPDAQFREKTLKFDEHYDQRDERGYQVDFLDGWNIPVPTTNDRHDGTVLKRDGAVWIIPYYHYSLVMNKTRRLLSWAASNVDYSDEARANTKTRKEYGGENWRLDPRVATEAPGLQVEDGELYKPAKKIDRGHIVRREDGAWGPTAREAEFGNSDTYHWTNCTPQSEAFNQSGKSGIWGQFEDHIAQAVVAEGGKMNVFAGPVLKTTDRVPENNDGVSLKVPVEFWKIVMCVSQENGQRVRRAYGFVFDQTEPLERLGFGFERMNMDDFEVFQMPINEITNKTGVVFDDSIHEADVMSNGHHESLPRVRGFRGKKVTELGQIVLR